MSATSLLDRSFHLITVFGWIAKLFLSKGLHVNKRGELNDERNTFKIETVDELESTRFYTMLNLNKSGRLLVTVIEVGGLHKCPIFN